MKMTEKTSFKKYLKTTLILITIVGIISALVILLIEKREELKVRNYRKEAVILERDLSQKKKELKKMISKSFLVKYISVERNGDIIFEIRNNTKYDLKNFIINASFYNELGDKISFGDFNFMYGARDLNGVIKGNTKKIIVFDGYEDKELFKMYNYKISAKARLVKFESTNGDYFDVRDIVIRGDYLSDYSHGDGTYQYPMYLNSLQSKIEVLSKDIEKFKTDTNCCSQVIEKLKNTEER